jgi:hypothetical protein
VSKCERGKIILSDKRERMIFSSSSSSSFHFLQLKCYSIFTACDERDEKKSFFFLKQTKASVATDILLIIILCANEK